jgi:hypothetical protein
MLRNRQAKGTDYVYSSSGRSDDSDAFESSEGPSPAKARRRRARSSTRSRGRASSGKRSRQHKSPLKRSQTAKQLRLTTPEREVRASDHRAHKKFCRSKANRIRAGVEPEEWDYTYDEEVSSQGEQVATRPQAADANKISGQARPEVRTAKGGRR